MDTWSNGGGGGKEKDEMEALRNKISFVVINFWDPLSF